MCEFDARNLNRFGANVVILCVRELSLFDAFILSWSLNHRDS